MSKKSRNYFITAGVFFAAFLLLVIGLKTIDVADWELGSKIGFSSLNIGFYKATGYSAGWHNLTGKVGYAVFAVAAAFVGLAVYQAISRKSLKKVDGALYVLGASYVIVAFLYVFFDLVVVNYRPVTIEDKLDPSFPSTHTFMAAYICSSAAVLCFKYFKNGTVATVCACALSLLGAFIVIGRTLSGVHWFTDIIGGLLLSGALFFAFSGCLEIFSKSEKELEQTEKNA